MNLTEKIRKADFGNIKLTQEGEIKHSVGYLEGNNFPARAYSFLSQSKSLIRTNFLTKLGVVATSKGKRAFVRNFLKNKGEMNWYAMQNNIWIGATITHAKSSLSDFVKLYREADNILKIKEYDVLLTSTIVPGKVMEKAGWKHTNHYEPTWLSFFRKKNVPIYAKPREDLLE